MPSLEITEILVNLPKSKSDESPLLAYVRIVLNGSFAINGIRVIKGKFGEFVAFPQEYNQKEERRFSVCHPIRKDTHEEMSKRILAAYRETVSL